MDDVKKQVESLIGSTEVKENTLGNKAEARLEWAHKWFSTRPSYKPGTFKYKDRAWLLDFYKAIDGFKAWPAKEGTRLCSDCADIVDTLILSDSEIAHTREPTHYAEHKCFGLIASNIYFIFVDADRRSGKTVGFASAFIAKLFQDKMFFGKYLATGMEHTMKLAIDNIIKPIKANKALMDNCKIIESSKNPYVEVEAMKSKLEFGSSSIASNLGGSYDLVALDECRSVQFKIFSALWATIQDNHGLKCTVCKWRARHEDIKELELKQCPVCHNEITKWVGKFLFGSNRGNLTGDVNLDWFPIIVDSLEAKPSRYAYVIKCDSNVEMNPDINTEAKEAAVDVFYRNKDMKDMIASELDNTERIPGEIYLDENEIKSILDPSLRQHETSIHRCFGFFDVAETVDKLSMTLWRDITDEVAPGLNMPWYAIESIFLKVWIPKDNNAPMVKRHSDGVIGTDEKLLEAYLIKTLTGFPRLVSFWVDTRGKRWARDMVNNIRNTVDWGYKVRPFTGRDAERDASYDLFHNKVIGGNIKVIYNEHIVKEAARARWKRVGTRMTVAPANEGRGAKTRAKNHLDILDNIATSCYLASLVVTMENSKYVNTEHISKSELLERAKKSVSGDFENRFNTRAPNKPDKKNRRGFGRW